MVISADFSSLWRAVRKMSEVPAAFDLASDFIVFEPVDTALAEGLEINIEDIDFSGLVASYQGRQVLLYIPDHGHRVEEVLAGREAGKKFHVTDCITLDEMRRKNRFQRYFATNDLSGDFTIHGHGQRDRSRNEGKARLRICINCMKHLNYRGYKTDIVAKEAFIKDFSIKEFFESYSSCFRTMPKAFRITDNGNYTPDWRRISDQLKVAHKYCCEECTVDMTEAKGLLHVHHINGVKSDNGRGNLQVLCADCHRRQPFHGHIHISHPDMQTINRMRRKSQIKSDAWDEALKYADKATYGALALLRKEGYLPPEIGYEIHDHRQAVIAEFEAAWPTKKFALVVSATQKVRVPGWKVQTVSELHGERA